MRRAVLIASVLLTAALGFSKVWTARAAVFTYGELQEEQDSSSEPLGASKSVRNLKSTPDASMHFIRLDQSEVPHVHDAHDIVAFILSGRARVHVEALVHETERGDVVEIPRGIVHWAEKEGEEPLEIFAVFTPPLKEKDYREVAQEGGDMVQKVKRSEEEWKKILTPDEYQICRRKGTERPFSGEYVHGEEKGVFTCVACGLELFGSDTKFDSGTGWPSFWAPIVPGHIQTARDRNFFMNRTEVLCARCDSHLGHVFEDGPPPTNLRYCINSVCLKFRKT